MGDGGRQENDRDGTGGGEPPTEAERVTRLLGGLLIVLGEKVREAGPEAVRILTDEEVQRANLQWYRTGWEEHARAVRPSGEPGPSGHVQAGPSGSGDPARPAQHPADPDPLSAMGRLLDFPGRTARAAGPGDEPARAKPRHRHDEPGRGRHERVRERGEGADAARRPDGDG
ncbi:hypothetical protein ABZX30_34975 [Streptomyces sp. NPDC004542]|uniref:hypothetical protein n=1 Tax=Streptomyces sp. NPDC004542 TaxID=3154281 RepID=UPI0033B390EE